MNADELRPNVTVYGPLFPDPVQVIVTVPMGESVKLIGKGLKSSKVYEPILSVNGRARKITCGQITSPM
jgi:hypothetical protein